MGTVTEKTRSNLNFNQGMTMSGKPIVVPKVSAFKPSSTFCVPEEILVAALYHGLESYTTSNEVICSEIRAHASSLRNKTRNLFVKEIKEELARSEASPDSPWLKDWERTLNVLEGGKPLETE